MEEALASDDRLRLMALEEDLLAIEQKEPRPLNEAHDDHTALKVMERKMTKSKRKRLQNMQFALADTRKVLDDLSAQYPQATCRIEPAFKQLAGLENRRNVCLRFYRQK